MYAVRLATSPSDGCSRKVVTIHWLIGKFVIGPRSTGFFDCFRNGGTTARKIGGIETSAPITPPSPSVAALRKPWRVVAVPAWRRAGGGGPGFAGGGAAGFGTTG